MRAKYFGVCLAIALLAGAFFWVLEGIINYYLFHENLRFFLVEGPKSFADSILFRISPRALVTRLTFAGSCLLAGVLVAVFIIREKEKDAALKRTEAWHLGLANLAQETEDLEEYLEKLHLRLAAMFQADLLFVKTTALERGEPSTFLFGPEEFRLDFSELLEELSDRMLKGPEPMLLNRRGDGRVEARPKAAGSGPRNPAGWMGTRLTRKDRTIGVMAVLSWDRTRSYSQENLRTLLIASQQVAAAVERKSSVEALKSAERKFSKAFLASPVWMLLSLADSGRVIEVNEAYLKASGYAKEEVIGRRDIDLGLWKSEADRLEVLDLIRRHDSLKNIELEMRGKNNRPAFVHFSGEIVEINGQECLLTTALDLSEKKLLESQLRQAQKMEAVGALAGGVAHDFNNLLQVINGHTQLLLLDKEKQNPDYAKLTAVHEAGLRAAGLVRQLLLFSRKAEIQRRPLKLNDEISRTRKILERTLPKMIQIELSLEESLWVVLADPIQIEQILLNLGVNAADAMPDGGRLLIETANIFLDNEYARRHLGARPGRYAVLTVSDTGQGMDRETLEKIFEPFFTTKEFGKGTGLGLASVYGAVKSHDGYIMCYSEPGRGTCFKIYLPAVDEPPAAEIKPEPSTGTLQGGVETILLVDDDEAIRDFGRQALMNFNYQVLTAASGEEALEVYSKNGDRIDLVILDVGMPGMGGHKCLQALLEFDPLVKVVISSGYSANGQVKDTLEAGARGYVGKPYQLKDLLDVLRNVLDDVSIQ